MKCCVCGAESGRYPLCRACNQQKELGYIIKCPVCGQWHYGDEPCPKRVQLEFLYEPKKRLITKNEQGFFDALREIVPQGYHVFPQINLAAFLEKVDNSAYHNELFRNVDFLITDGEFAPKIVVEINDNTHHKWERRQRDEKVSAICADAGIPLVTFWTNYGVNRPYIEKRIREALETPPQRVPSFTKENTAQPNTFEKENAARQAVDWDVQAEQHNKTHKGKQGCYIATCVYGSYDCPQVWTLRRYRDIVLKSSVLGRTFIAVYYAISPALVRIFSKSVVVKKIWRSILNPMVKRLNEKGFSNNPYTD